MQKARIKGRTKIGNGTFQSGASDSALTMGNNKDMTD